jgi:hypothetical protein
MTQYPIDSYAARCFAMPGCFILVLMFGCDRVFYYPDRKVRGSPADDRLAYEDVFFASDDGTRLHGWFMPAQRAARGTVLHMHGNAANITGHYEFVSWLPAAGFNVFTFDYRGYGRSGGHVTREGTVRDACAALDYLRARRDVQSEPILLFGQSIGGAVATVVAARRKDQIAALALDSTFASYKGIVRYHVTHQPVFLVLAWWLPMLIADGLDPQDHIASVSPVPVMIIHGKQDRIAPWVMGQNLFDAAKEPKEVWLIEDTNHMEVWFEKPREARARLTEFFDRAIAARGLPNDK